MGVGLSTCYQTSLPGSTCSPSHVAETDGFATEGYRLEPFIKLLTCLSILLLSVSMTWTPSVEPGTAFGP